MSTVFFVTPEWLLEHLSDPEVQVIDARMAAVGNEKCDIQQEYLAGHLPSAPFFDIEALSDHNSPLPHTMPRPETFAVAMRELGIHQDKHLVVYDDGSLFSAPRAWWMLRAFGVETISILSGGLAAWRKQNLPLETGVASLPESDFDVHFDPEVMKTSRMCYWQATKAPPKLLMPGPLRVSTQKLMNPVQVYAVGIYRAR